MNFAAEEGFARQSVYFSDDQNAVAIWKSPTEKKMSIPLVHAYLDFGVKMGWSKTRRILQMEARLKKIIPTTRIIFIFGFWESCLNTKAKG